MGPVWTRLPPSPSGNIAAWLPASSFTSGAGATLAPTPTATSRATPAATTGVLLPPGGHILTLQDSENPLALARFPRGTVGPEQKLPTQVPRESVQDPSPRIQ